MGYQFIHVGIGGSKMKEYKIIETTKNKAEEVMNDMAKLGWEVVSVNFWNMWKGSLMITFSRGK